MYYDNSRLVRPLDSEHRSAIGLQIRQAPFVYMSYRECPSAAWSIYTERQLTRRAKGLKCIFTIGDTIGVSNSSPSGASINGELSQLAADWRSSFTKLAAAACSEEIIPSRSQSRARAARSAIRFRLEKEISLCQVAFSATLCRAQKHRQALASILDSILRESGPERTNYVSWLLLSRAAKWDARQRVASRKEEEECSRPRSPSRKGQGPEIAEIFDKKEKPIMIGVSTEGTKRNTSGHPVELNWTGLNRVELQLFLWYLTTTVCSIR